MDCAGLWYFQSSLEQFRAVWEETVPLPFAELFCPTSEDAERRRNQISFKTCIM